MRKFIAITAAALSAAFLATGAHAATCDSGDTPDYSGLLTSNSGCEIGSVNNDTVGGGVLQVNTDNLFGAGLSQPSWIYAAKDNDVNGSIDETGPAGNFGFSVNGAKSGTWSFASSLFDTYLEALIVQKGGRGSDQQEYVGFLITKPDGFSGSYSTVFSKRGNAQDISHMTLYVRGTPTGPGPGPGPSPSPVPVPAAGLLLIGALGAIGGLRARRKS